MDTIGYKIVLISVFDEHLHAKKLVIKDEDRAKALEVLSYKEGLSTLAMLQVFLVSWYMPKVKFGIFSLSANFFMCSVNFALIYYNILTYASHCTYKKLEPLLLKYEPVLIESSKELKTLKASLDEMKAKSSGNAGKLYTNPALKENNLSKLNYNQITEDDSYKEKYSENSKFNNESSRNDNYSNTDTLSQNIYTSNYNRFNINSTKNLSYAEDQDFKNRFSQENTDTAYDNEIEDQKNKFSGSEVQDLNDSYSFYINQAKKLQEPLAAPEKKKI